MFYKKKFIYKFNVRKSNLIFYRNENVKLYTDYLPMIQSLSFPSQYERFAKNILEIREIAEQFPYGITFQHIYAHSNNIGNEEVINFFFNYF